MTKKKARVQKNVYKIGSQKERTVGKQYADNDFRNKMLISIMEAYIFHVE